MDKYRHTEQDLLEAALAAARRLGVAIEQVRQKGQQANGVDALIRIRHGGKNVLYATEVRRGLRPATLGAVLHRLERASERPLVVTDYVTPPLADELKKRQVAFLDTAGNAYLDQPPLLVWVKGERLPEKTAGQGAAGRAFQPSGLKVLFAILCRPELINEPYRDIAAQAGVAHGTVGWVMAELPNLGFVAEVGGKRRLLQPERLLQQWVEAYARTLRPRLVLARYRAETIDWWKILDPLKYGLVLGGEPAAARLTKYLQPGTVTLYGAKAEPRFVLDHGLRTDAAGDVEILQRFWRFENDPPALAPTVLVYADLLAIGDARCLETAKLLREDFLARFGE